MTKKRADNRYQKKILTGYNLDGTPKYHYVYARTLKELEEKYYEAKNALMTGAKLEKPRMTVSQLAKEWYDYKLPSWKASTAASERSNLNYIDRTIGCRVANEIRVTHVDQLRLDAIRNNESSRYNSAIRSLKAIYVFGIRREHIDRNPFQYAERIKITRRQKRALTAAELRAIEEADLTPPERVFVDILLYTGVRKGEALALSTDDVDLYKRRITITKNVFEGKMQDTPKTAAGTRSIPTPTALYHELAEYVNMVENGLLFPNANGQCMRPASFAIFWQDITRRIFGDDVPEGFTPHLFRHNYASDLFKAGLDIKTAQYLLGHTDVKTTLDTYTHFGYDDVNIDRLEMLYKSKKSDIFKRPRVSKGCQIVV